MHSFNLLHRWPLPFILVTTQKPEGSHGNDRQIMWLSLCLPTSLTVKAKVLAMTQRALTLASLSSLAPSPASSHAGLLTALNTPASNGCVLCVLILACPSDDGWNVRGEWERGYFLGVWQGIMRVIRKEGSKCRLCTPYKTAVPPPVLICLSVNHRNATPWEWLVMVNDWLAS